DISDRVGGIEVCELFKLPFLFVDGDRRFRLDQIALMELEFSQRLRRHLSICYAPTNPWGRTNEHRLRRGSRRQVCLRLGQARLRRLPLGSLRLYLNGYPVPALCYRCGQAERRAYPTLLLWPRQLECMGQPVNPVSRRLLCQLLNLSLRGNPCLNRHFGASRHHRLFHGRHRWPAQKGLGAACPAEQPGRSLSAFLSGDLRPSAHMEVHSKPPTVQPS